MRKSPLQQNTIAPNQPPNYNSNNSAINELRNKYTNLSNNQDMNLDSIDNLDKLQEDHEQLIQLILEEEEELINAHRVHID